MDYKYYKHNSGLLIQVTVWASGAIDLHEVKKDGTMVALEREYTPPKIVGPLSKTKAKK